MRKNLIYFQDLFNEIFDFENLRVKAENHVKEELKNIDSCIYRNCSKDEIIAIQKMYIEYINTRIVLNRINKEPVFSLRFDLCISEDELSEYTYRLEYNFKGNLIDEYLEFY